MGELKELQGNRDKLNKKIYKLEADEQNVKNQKLIGKCFKTRNCYSSPEKKSDYWWLYVKVTGTKHGNLRSTKFQIDKYRGAEIKTNEFASVNMFGIVNYIEISELKFNKALDRFLDEVTKMADSVR